MNKPLLGSLVVATLLLGDASAATMYERFETMEKEMQRLQNELANLRAEQAEAEPAAMADDEEADEEESEEAAEDEAIKVNYKKESTKLKNIGYKRIPMTRGKPEGKLNEDFIEVTRPSGDTEYWLIPKMKIK